ncbi:MAG: transposase [Anaerolineae bacterium]|nr:transposase [Anaerolineae bacterium]
MIPSAKPSGLSRSLDMYKCINTILYVVVGGIQWRMLSKDYAIWHSMYY